MVSILIVFVKLAPPTDTFANQFPVGAFSSVFTSK